MCLFLQDWRSTLIPLLAAPVSLISTVVVFPFLSFSTNVLSLFGLVLAFDLVAHDVMIVVEAASTDYKENKPNRSCRKE